MINRTHKNRSLLKTRKSEIITALAMFAGTVFLAWWYHWDTGDLAWGLWITSVTLGYSYIIVALIGGLILGDSSFSLSNKSGSSLKKQATSSVQNAAQGLFLAVILFFIIGFHRYTFIFLIYSLFTLGISMIPMALEKKGMPVRSMFLFYCIRLLTGIPFMIFMLIFFTIHFLGFHFGHSLFLNWFFPRVDPSALFNSIEEGFQTYRILFIGLLSQYWIFILTSAISRLKQYSRAFHSEGKDTFMRPYINVIRMHIMIILFGVMHAINLSGAMIYLLLVLYFFPIGSLIFNFRKKRKQFKPA